MEYEIIELPKEQWKGTPILMKYTTNEYFDLEIEGAEGNRLTETARRIL